MTFQKSTRTHCKRGHEYTPENSRYRDGRKSCKVCANARRRDLRRKAAQNRPPNPIRRTKRCTKCLLEKTVEMFSMCKTWRQSRCKACLAAQKRAKRRDRSGEKRLADSVARTIQNRRLYWSNPEKYRAQARAHYKRLQAARRMADLVA